MIKINRPPCPNPKALKTNYKYPENKEALINASFGKCMYCESKITHIDYGDIEHIKPKSKFPNLEFDWNNLGYACVRCNRKHKQDKFNENNPHINPYEDNPNNHIVAFGSLLHQKQGSEKGEITILNIGLNRSSLIEKRNEKINTIQRVINACFRTSDSNLKENALVELKKEAEEDKEFSLCVKSLLKTQGIL
jgi:uncharacterized protein (TIGR02646 family)